MDMNLFAVILNSTIRSTTPVLLAALGSTLCNRTGVFNIALEGQMLIGCFVSILVNYYTGSVLLATMAGVMGGMVVGGIVALFQVKYEAADMVVGTSVNLLVSGITSIFLFIIFGVKGQFSSPQLIPMTRVRLPLISSVPVVNRVFENLTCVDYLSWAIAVVMFVYFFRTVSGFRLISVGVNREAAESLGVKAIRTRVTAVILSGALCGLGGTALSMGQVTLFTENMTSGRGFIAMAASSMGQHHPLYVILSSFFFGAAQASGVAMQNRIPSQLTMAVPYIATIVALAIFSRKRKKI